MKSSPSASSGRCGPHRCCPSRAISSPRSPSPSWCTGGTHSAFLTALAYALTYLPPIAGGPLLSGLADLFPRRRVMIVCDLLRIGTVGLMAVPGMPFGALCVLLFCTVLTGTPFSSACGSRPPDVLPGDKFVLGSAIGNISYQASQILGFVAGAAVVAIINPYKTLGLDAVSFGISALIVATESGRGPRHSGTRARGRRCGRCRPTGSGSCSVTASW